MSFPDFFAEIPALRLHDGLAQLLGASDDGVIEYHYADAVRLAGHSCPTVAGGWLSVRERPARIALTFVVMNYSAIAGLAALRRGREVWR